MMKKTFNSESVQGKLFNAQRSNARPCLQSTRHAWQSESDLQPRGPLALEAFAE